MSEKQGLVGIAAEQHQQPGRDCVVQLKSKIVQDGTGEKGKQRWRSEVAVVDESEYKGAVVAR